MAFGELLLRLEAPGRARIVQAESFGARYTGAEANVAVALAGLGLTSCAVSKVPDNEVGRACVNYLRRFGVGTAHVATGGPRLGLLYLETGAPPRPTRVVYDRAGSSFCTSTAADYDWPAILEGAAWLHFSGTALLGGSAVAGALEEGVRLARSLGVPVSCDLNFRAKLWNEEQAAGALLRLLPAVEVLLGSGEDAARVLGVPFDTADLDHHGLTKAGHEHVAHELARRYGIAHVAGVLRSGPAGSVPHLSGVLTGNGATVTSREHPPPSVVDRIGAGDAFSAGIIFGFVSGWAPERTVGLASALYCLAHTVEGDFALVDLAEAEALATGSATTRVER